MSEALSIETVLSGYLEALDFTECGVDGDIPAGASLAQCALGKARSDCLKFINQCALQGLDQAWIVAGMDAAQFGRDFWFTRNGHGVGYWDRGLGDIGDKLTKLAHDFGEVYAYLGDDGLVYIDGGK